MDGHARHIQVQGLCMLSTHDTVFVDETRKGTISKVERGRQASETKQFRIKRLKMKMACTLSISRRENKGRHWWPRST